MKRASKILTLILVFVLLAGVFSGCAMFTRNTSRYRDLVAVNVGSEEITVGKILDTFNNYYSTYGSYIGQGITVDSLLQMAMQSVVTQAMKVDSYVSGNPEATDNTQMADYCRNAQYLTKEEMEFAVKYVKYLTFHTFDDSVLSILNAKRDIADEETEDTSRDFAELDDLEGRNYSEYDYRKRVFSKDAEEYFDKYYKGITVTLDSSVDEYVYKDAAAAKTILDELNSRRADDDAEITFDEYVSTQEKVVKQYKRSVENTYRISFDKFMVNQVADIVASTIAAKYDYSVNKSIDTTNLTQTIETLTQNLATNKKSQSANFALNDNFVEFIEGLTSTSYIYNVPEKYNYIYVKNILVPFTEQQKTTLSNLSADLGGKTDAPAYVELRDKYASEIIADDFNSQKDKDGKYQKVENLFAMKDGKLIVNPAGEMGSAFVNGKVVASDGKTADETVIDYMKRFNTDTAQHSALYDYVVRVGDNIPSNYTAKWVPEFVAAAKEAYAGGIGSYALAVSTYGVHIVYYTGDVVAQDIHFDADRIKDTSLPEYRLFTAYYSQQSSRLLQDNVEALQKSYLEDNKISTNKNFNKFLKDNNFKFDLLEYLKGDED